MGLFGGKTFRYYRMCKSCIFFDWNV